MEQIQKHAPLALCALLVLKQLILGSDPSQAAITIALVGILSVKELMEKNKKYSEIETNCKKSLEEMMTIVHKQNEILNVAAKEVALMKQSVESIKMSSGMRKVI